MEISRGSITPLPEPTDPEWWTPAEREAAERARASATASADRNTLAEHRMHMDTPGASCAPTCPYYTETNARESGAGHTAQYTAKVEREVERDPFSSRTDNLATDQGDRPVYAWVVEGDLNTGPLTRYAHDIQSAHYSGCTVGKMLTLLVLAQPTYSGTVLAIDATPEFHDDGTDDEGYPTWRHTRIVVRDGDGKIIDAADYMIDMRA